MAGIALKGQCNLVSIMVPPGVLFKRKMKEKHFCYCNRIISVTAFRNSIIYIRTIFSLLKIIKEFVLDLMLEAVDIV